MVTTKEDLSLYRELVEPEDLDTKSEHFVTGELDKVVTLVINNGTITTAPVRNLRYSHVKEMRVYGDHEAEFPREGVRFTKDGERPVESVSVEGHPQKLIVRGGIQPSYRVSGMDVDFRNHTGKGQVVSSMTRVLKPTSFSIWAEYISPEEAELLKSKGNPRVIGYNEILGRLEVPGFIYGAVSLFLGFAYFVSLSPDVKLTFPDGRIDKDSGAQVMRFDGKIDPSRKSSYQPTIMTNHYQGEEVLMLPDVFRLDGDFSVMGRALKFSDSTLDVYGNRFIGRLDYNKGRASLVGNVQI